MPLYWPQSWNESSTVIASGTTRTPTNSISAGAASVHGARASRLAAVAAALRRSRIDGCAHAAPPAPRRLMSSAPPSEPNGLALRGLRLAVVLADHDHGAAFALALE